MECFIYLAAASFWGTFARIKAGASSGRTR
jgi:hypothetical protein